MARMNATIDREAFSQGQTAISLLQPRLSNPTEAPCPFAGAACTVEAFSPGKARALCFRSEWGREMTPVWRKAAGTELAVTAGRSSHGWSPFLFLRDGDGSWLWVALCHSGNWRLRLTEDGEIRFLLDEAMLSGTLPPGGSLALPRVLTARSRDWNELRQDVCRFLRRWLPPTRMDPSVVSWNPWWKYEDCDLNEDVMLRNARAAKELGVDLIVLDAGWFGGTDSDSHWTRRRGDWEQEDRARFPHGVPWLAEQLHRLGLKFGIWMEPEGMGLDSALRRRHPEWEALRDGRPLPEPSLCLAAEGAADWLYAQMAELVSRTRADWLKLDFNTDPGYGCNRSDHGHPPGMGLYTHLTAYAGVLDQLRQSFPQLVVENCSSGGLRLDLDMMAHTDVCFLSDPDEADHSLQVFSWLSFLPPERLLHWAWSDTRVYPDGSRVFPGLPAQRLPELLPAAMLHPFGFSRDLTALGAEQKRLVAEAIAFYRREIAPILGESTVRMRTAPPQRTTPERAADDGRRLSPSPGPWALELVHPDKTVALTLCGEGRAEMTVHKTK